MNLAFDIVELHDRALARWYGEGADLPDIAPNGQAPTFADLVEAEHFANFTIWRLEDDARLRDVDDARIATVKRAIDPWNQRRNDLMDSHGSRRSSPSSRA